MLKSQVERGALVGFMTHEGWHHGVLMSQAESVPDATYRGVMNGVPVLVLGDRHDSWSGCKTSEQDFDTLVIVATQGSHERFQRAAAIERALLKEKEVLVVHLTAEPRGGGECQLCFERVVQTYKICQVAACTPVMCNTCMARCPHCPFCTC